MSRGSAAERRSRLTRELTDLSSYAAPASCRRQSAPLLLAAAPLLLSLCPKSWAPALLPPTYSSHPNTPATVTSHVCRFFCCKSAIFFPHSNTVFNILG